MEYPLKFAKTLVCYLFYLLLPIRQSGNVGLCLISAGHCSVHNSRPTFPVLMFPKRNNKRFFDYESASNIVSDSAMITSSIIPTVQLSTTLTSITMTTTTTTSVHPTSTTVSYIYIHKNKNKKIFFFLIWTILFMILNLGQNVD